MTPSQWIELLSVWPTIPFDWAGFADWLEEQGKDVEASIARRVAKKDVDLLARNDSQTLLGDDDSKNSTWWDTSHDSDDGYIEAQRKLPDDVFLRLPHSVDVDAEKLAEQKERVWSDEEYIPYKEYISEQEAIRALVSALLT